MVAVIEDLGYGVPQPAEGEDVEEETRLREYGALKRRFWLSAGLAAPVVIAGMWPGLMHLPVMAWIQLVLTTPVILFAGAPFYQGAGSPCATARPI